MEVDQKNNRQPHIAMRNLGAPPQHLITHLISSPKLLDCSLFACMLVLLKLSLVYHEHLEGGRGGLGKGGDGRQIQVYGKLRVLNAKQSMVDVGP